MSNKKRIQKKLSNINLNFEIKKFQIAMKILNALIENKALAWISPIFIFIFFFAKFLFDS